MSSALWDPANLLQITDNLRDRSGKVHCVGITKYDARCKWTIDEPDLSEIRPLLNQMSQSPPDSITLETLRQLARLCLCSKFHSNQVGLFAGHWTTVIKAATQHHKNMMALDKGQNLGDIDSLRSQLSIKTEEVLHFERELASARQAILYYSRDEQELKNQTKYLEKQLRESQTRQESAETLFLDIEQSHQVLQTQVSEESMARKEADQENITLRAKIQEAEDQLEGYELVKEEKADLRQEIARLEEENEKGLRQVRAEVDKCRTTEQQLAVERVAKESMAHQYQDQLEEQQTQSFALKSRIASLEMIVAQLEASISACWSHRFWAWMAKVRKDRKSQQCIGAMGEQVEEIPLKTYA
ncbi:hypothetical protein NW762_010829 [Fusarium torreyae]|uniref:Uncharacterized protein n=1 Tax=Fusarium torreyae TaxID=1237075 RepID=A0A9W8RSS3_9HYPO|nr:hypothetical protein NW762_010829 [Fusarium torreyae]